jgi:hypothetical protein
MAGAVLTPAERASFLAALRRQGNSAVHRRMNALLLLDDGWTAERLAGPGWSGWPMPATPRC